MDYNSTLRKIQEERTSDQHRAGSLKSRNSYNKFHENATKDVSTNTRLP